MPGQNIIFFHFQKVGRQARIGIENPWKEKCLVNYDDGTRVKKGRDGIEYIFQETGPLSFDNGKLLAVFSTYRMLFE